MIALLFAIIVAVAYRLERMRFSRLLGPMKDRAAMNELRARKVIR